MPSARFTASSTSARPGSVGTWIRNATYSRRRRLASLLCGSGSSWTR
jgi:hypothetical protein